MFICDFSIYDLRLKWARSCGSDDASSSHAVQYSIVTSRSRRRGRTPLATATRLTSFGGYFATSASRFAFALGIFRHIGFALPNRNVQLFEAERIPLLAASLFIIHYSFSKRKGFRFSIMVHYTVQRATTRTSSPLRFALQS